MANQPLFLETWGNLRQAMIPYMNDDQSVYFKIRPCSGWGVFIRGMLAQGEELLLFCPEEELSAVIQHKIGAPDLFSLPPEWLAPLMLEVVRPFEALCDEPIIWKNFYPQQCLRTNVGAFHWPAQEEQRMDFTLFCLRAPQEWLKTCLNNWKECHELASGYDEGISLPSFGLVFGMNWLSFSELKTLEAESALKLALCAQTSEGIAAAWLVWSNPLASVIWKENDKCLEVIDMIDADEFTQTQIAHCFGFQTPICVTALLGEVQMSLDDLQKLAHGMEIREGVRLYEKIVLLANGVAFAFGELIQVDESWMVRITEKFGTERHELNEQRFLSGAIQSADVHSLAPLPVDISQKPQPALNQEEALTLSSSGDEGRLSHEEPEPVASAQIDSEQVHDPSNDH